MIFIQILCKQKIWSKVLRDRSFFDYRAVVGFLGQAERFWSWCVMCWHKERESRQTVWGQVSSPLEVKAVLRTYLERESCSFSSLEMARTSRIPGLTHVELGCVSGAGRSSPAQGHAHLLCFYITSYIINKCLCAPRGHTSYIHL